MTDDFDRRLNPYRYDSGGHLTHAAREQDRQLRLDSYNENPGGALAVDASLLKQRSGQCDGVAADFKHTCSEPLGDTEDAGKGLAGFECASAFSTLAERWKSETQYVTVSLLEKFAADLRQSADEYEKNDKTAAAAFRH